MLIPVDQYTNTLWHTALQANLKDSKGYSLTNWLTSKVASEDSLTGYVILMANEHDNKDQESPQYFDWVCFTVNSETLPESIKDQYPATKETIFKYGQKEMNGGLIKDLSGGWSSHT